MNINHHPSDELLLDYVTGGLGETWSLAVATHLALCPACRRQVARLEAVGGDLLQAAEPTPVGADSLDAVMARLDAPEVEEEAPAPRAPSRSGLPQPLRRYAENAEGDLEWRRLGRGASQLLIGTGDPSATARLLRIPAGKPVPVHSHRGMELTLVLAGAFSDSTGRYGPGDFQEADESLEHQPHATPEADCICLAVTDAPLRFRSVAARLLQPLLGI
jgi:putative transcriptional regulator